MPHNHEMYKLNRDEAITLITTRSATKLNHLLTPVNINLSHKVRVS